SAGESKQLLRGLRGPGRSSRGLRFTEEFGKMLVFPSPRRYNEPNISPGESISGVQSPGQDSGVPLPGRERGLVRNPPMIAAPCPGCGNRLPGQVDSCPQCGRLVRQPTVSAGNEPTVLICANC